MRWSPSVSSTVLRPLSAISLTNCSKSPRSIGPDLEMDGAPALAPGPFFLLVRFSLNVAALEAPVQVRKHLVTGVGNQHVILDADAAFAGQINSRLDCNDHSRPQFFLGGPLAQTGQFVNIPAN